MRSLRVYRAVACLLVVAALYLFGPLFLPTPLQMFAPHRAALGAISYGLLGLFLAAYVACTEAIRWSIVPIGGGFGVLAAAVGQNATMLVFEPARWSYLIAHHGWSSVAESAASTLIGALVLGVWLSGAAAGAVILALDWKLRSA